jgi:hypothetical protein
METINEFHLIDGVDKHQNDNLIDGVDKHQNDILY